MRLEDYGLIGDMQSAALVGIDGSIDWLCFPRFDSGACFASLLGDDDNGHWRIAPTAVGDSGRATRRRYRGDTLVLETEWVTRGGTVRVVDFMPPRGEAPDVVRIVEGVSGRVEMRSVLRLRFDYGRSIPWVRRDDGQHVAVAGPDAMWLRTDAEVHGEDFASVSDFAVSAGEEVSFVLTWHPSHLPAPHPVLPTEELVSTLAYWEDWVARSTYRGGWRDAVVRSLITLKALTYSPTGGIVAAATTSIPEDIGGVRNWDYRFCWLRDSTMTLVALLSAGYLDEANAWRDWLLRAIAGSAKDLQIMYGVAGERRLSEHELPWLAGYEGSTPVRIGNQAAEQFQLDVYGEVISTLCAAEQASGMGVIPHAWSMQVALLDYLEGVWQQPDEGLWEVRGPRQHFTHSKVMAWVAVDRMIAAAEHSSIRAPLRRWRAMRDAIHAEICERAYDPHRNTFVQAYGSGKLDAATLMIPQVGFLPATDPRVVGTIEAVQRELCVDGLVLRYHTDGADGLPGDEGAFLACSFWLAIDLSMIGRDRQATELFEYLLSLRNDLGLLAEEYDPRLQRQVGNLPQAFSHVPLVNTAAQLSGRSPTASGVSPQRPHGSSR